MMKCKKCDKCKHFEHSCGVCWNVFSPFFGTIVIGQSACMHYERKSLFNRLRSRPGALQMAQAVNAVIGRCKDEV